MSKKLIAILAVIVILIGAGYYIYDISIKKAQISALEGITLQPTEADTLVVTVQDEEGNPVDVDISDWQIYRNEELGFQFRFPPDHMMDVNASPSEDLASKGLILGFTIPKLDQDLEEINYRLHFQGVGGFVKTSLSDAQIKVAELQTKEGEPNYTNFRISISDGRFVDVWRQRKYAESYSVIVPHNYFFLNFGKGSEKHTTFLALISSLKLFAD